MFLQLGKHKTQSSHSVTETKGIETEDTEVVSQCALPGRPRSVRNAYLFGGTANSRQEFKHIPKQFNQK